MTSPGALLPPDSYYWVCALTWAACFFGAKLAVRHPRPTLYATIAVVPLYLLAHLTFQGASAGAAPDKAIALFDALKSAAVFFPVVLYAFATLKLAERAREHESTRAREHESTRACRGGSVDLFPAFCA